MIDYKQWKMINESLMGSTLGLRQRQNLGLAEMDMTPEAPPMKKRPLMGKPPVEDEEDDDDLENDDDMLSNDEEGGDMGHEDHDDEDMDSEDEEGEEGDDEDDDDVDTDNDFDDDETDSLEGEDEEDDGDVMKKNKPMPTGNPHEVSAFMRSESFKGCKKMKDGDCCKCKGKCKCKKMEEDFSSYPVPKERTGSYSEWKKSVSGMLGDPYKKNFDGLSEDLLLPPVEPSPLEPRPGQVGYAPQNAINYQESVQNLMKRIKKLESKLKKK